MQSRRESLLEHPRIELAHEPDFAVGSLNVHPSTRELSRDGKREVIEPRVMQVLVALHRTAGAVVSKDDLAQCCWEGRIVGEDAINRVLSRLRKVSEGIAKGAFWIETVTRVGYRLITDGQDGPLTAPSVGSKKTMRSNVSRRTVLIGAGIALSAVGGGVIFRNRQSAGSTELTALLNKAEAALKNATIEQTAAAVGLLQEATRRYPRNAEVWGRLAIAYRRQGVNNLLASGVSILDRSEAAARRAIEIDPKNVDGAVVLAVGKGLWYSQYFEYDRRTQHALANFPDHEISRGARSTFLFETGRIQDSLTTGSPLISGVHLSPRATSHARKLWSAARLDEADSLLNTLIKRWPQNRSIWHTRHTFLAFSGRFEDCAAMLTNAERWPEGVEEIDVSPIRARVAALESNEPDKIAEVLRYFDIVAPINFEIARDAASFASAAGQLDAVFRYLDLMFVSGELARNIKRIFPARYFQPHSGKLTYFLFEPPMETARADPRFDIVTAHLGLAHYWRKENINPDYMNYLYKRI